MNATTPTFRTGTSFKLNGRICRVWRNTRSGKVEYVTEHSADRANDTFHASTRAALTSFAEAGLITAA